MTDTEIKPVVININVPIDIIQSMLEITKNYIAEEELGHEFVQVFKSPANSQDILKDLRKVNKFITSPEIQETINEVKWTKN